MELTLSTEAKAFTTAPGQASSSISPGRSLKDVTAMTIVPRGLHLEQDSTRNPENLSLKEEKFRQHSCSRDHF